MKCSVKASLSSSEFEDSRGHVITQICSNMTQNIFIDTELPPPKEKEGHGTSALLLLLHQLLGVSNCFPQVMFFPSGLKAPDKFKSMMSLLLNPSLHGGLAIHHLSPSHPKIIGCSVVLRSLALVPEVGLKKNPMNFTKTTSALGLYRGTPLIHVN